MTHRKFPKTSHKITQKPNGHTHRQKQYKPKTENNPAGRFAAGGLGSIMTASIVMTMTVIITVIITVNIKITVSIIVTMRVSITGHVTVIVNMGGTMTVSEI